MYSYAACLLVCLASAVRGTAAEVLPFTAAAELAVQAMRRPVLVKVDAPNCVDCPKLEEFWAMAGGGLPGGTVWRVECGREEEAEPDLCRSPDWDRRLPRFEAWDGARWYSYRGKPAVENLYEWMMNALQRPPNTASVSGNPSRARSAPTMESMGFAEKPSQRSRSRSKSRSRHQKYPVNDVDGDFYIEDDEDEDDYYEDDHYEDDHYEDDHYE
eukprot:g66.t1